MAFGILSSLQGTYDISKLYGCNQKSQLEFCKFKANADLKELIRKDNDGFIRHGRFRMNMTYWLIEIWYEQTDDILDHLLANNIHTWIAIKKPTFQDLIHDRQRACIALSAMARLNTANDLK